MIYNDVVFGCVNTDKIKLNPIEVANRLKTDVNYTNSQIDECKLALLNEIKYKYAYVIVDVNLSNQDICDFGFMKVESKNLYKNLNGCNKAYIIGVTIGNEVDRLLNKLTVISNASHFITDGLASAAVEALCDYINDEIKKDYKCRPRFSPGYGDVSLEVQRPVLKRLNASETLGISLNSALFMTPHKSITAIMGVSD